jgi:large subunit ribosomal protein L23
MNLEQVIIIPMMTEKSQYLQKLNENEETNVVKYCFKVHPDANKIMVKQAIQKIFGKKPSSVNIQIYKGKMKRFRNSPAKRPHWKKAIVSFPEATELQFNSGV